jgi:hypothetical protein
LQIWLKTESAFEELAVHTLMKAGAFNTERNAAPKQSCTPKANQRIGITWGAGVSFSAAFCCAYLFSFV